MMGKTTDAPSKRKVTITLPTEMAWQLRVVASYENRHPGQVVEEMISGPLAAKVQACDIGPMSTWIFEERASA